MHIIAYKRKNKLEFGAWCNVMVGCSPMGAVVKHSPTSLAPEWVASGHPDF